MEQTEDVFGGYEEINFYNFWMGFYHSVDWSEDWIIGLIIFHLSLFLLFIISFNNLTIQVLLWILARKILFI